MIENPFLFAISGIVLIMNLMLLKDFTLIALGFLCISLFGFKIALEKVKE